MSSISIRPAQPEDRSLITGVVEDAFEGPDEARLVQQLSNNGDIVLELVASLDGILVGHILFSRLRVEGENSFDAVALAPLSVASNHHGKGIGSALINAAHEQLVLLGETLSVVLGDPGYYGRFGYTTARASGFASQYQGEYLQAQTFGHAPLSGTLVYAKAFEGL
ncbi:GNAT family N-acetyltransferase [Phyllobacterium myrsinacearum]|uniref:Putative acetyltransferase n=1 Tax=Phyllobacterium myrsinacearum TaxID=28101 RepID=A0A839EBR7_9HYPH|nr:N-acetyltransferase [Phyllobacterium myrsinacearum]MBA8877351.1 putative acetyltransferase [Phyllobacterium myrsinacearum]